MSSFRGLICAPPESGVVLPQKGVIFGIFSGNTGSDPGGPRNQEEFRSPPGSRGLLEKAPVE